MFDLLDMGGAGRQMRRADGHTVRLYGMKTGLAPGWSDSTCGVLHKMPIMGTNRISAMSKNLVHYYFYYAAAYFHGAVICADLTLIISKMHKQDSL
jgi:hypothetical protein